MTSPYERNEEVQLENGCAFYRGLLVGLLLCAAFWSLAALLWWVL